MPVLLGPVRRDAERDDPVRRDAERDDPVRRDAERYEIEWDETEYQALQALADGGLISQLVPRLAPYLKSSSDPRPVVITHPLAG
ncbi:hypothetical protein [Frankia sp. Cppng1_Ct_nod]|uniref:hypothetical protein n=1 Tax=Frankia sp. Cppng1_Ct_nod TaxID=2897162 RepID=UPI001F5FEC0C|nr:hypothetical protein [Frankia sp. Cppng1_Ct_nod]